MGTEKEGKNTKITKREKELQEKDQKIESLSKNIKENQTE